MAHVGTTQRMEQPVVAGSGRPAGQWLAFIIGMAVLAIAAGLATMQGSVGSKAIVVSQAAPPVILDRGADRAVDVSQPVILDRGADIGAATSVPRGPDWYARHYATTSTVDANANADRNRHHLNRAPVRDRAHAHR